MILRFKPLKFESFMVCFHLYDVTFGWVKLTSGLLMFLLLIFHCQTREVNSSQGNACNVNRLFQNVISDAFLISDIGYLNFNMLKNKQTYIYIHIRKYILYTIYIYMIYILWLWNSLRDFSSLNVPVLKQSNQLQMADLQVTFTSRKFTHVDP